MPAPQATMMQNFARAKFMGNALKAPQNWQPPSNQEHYGKAFKDDEKMTAPDMGKPPGPLFTPATLNKYHTQTQKRLNSDFGNFIDKTCSAICSAWSQWQSTATLVGVMIAGPVASGGQVVGPPLQPLIMAQGAIDSPMKLKYTNTISQVIGTAWLQYTGTIKVPGLPWYPAFAMVPSPIGPPSPNVPCPVVTIGPSGSAIINASLLANQMFSQHGDPKAQYARELFDAISTGVATCFATWQTTTLVSNVIGTGPVPSFAPPYVPGGPVVGGIGAMTPGGFT